MRRPDSSISAAKLTAELRTCPSALSAEDVTSDVVALLVTEVAVAITAADQDAEAERDNPSTRLRRPIFLKAGCRHEAWRFKSEAIAMMDTNRKGGGKPRSIARPGKWLLSPEPTSPPVADSVVATLR
jgi:hypothetical protein